MRRFKWIEWNIQKIDAHHLSVQEVEAAFERAFVTRARADDSFETYAEIPSGRRIWVIWRYDEGPVDELDVLIDLEPPAIFVITAY